MRTRVNKELNRDLKICDGDVKVKYNFAQSHKSLAIIPSCSRHILLAKCPKNELVREISG